MQPAPQMVQARQHFQQAHQGEVLHREQADKSLQRHLLAADTGEGEFRPARSECRHHAGAECIAARLAGDQIDQRHYDSTCARSGVSVR